MIISKSLESLEITLLLEAIFHRFGDDFRNHQREVITHKLKKFLQAHDIPTVSALQNLVLHDTAYINALLHSLDARQADLFDHPNNILELRKIMLPWLRSSPAPKIWLSDCVCAEDVYAIAILLTEENIYSKTHIFATGANATLLSEARQGKFPIKKLPLYEKNYLSAGGVRSLASYYRQVGGVGVFNPELADNITWAQYNLGTDASFNEFELIICRGGLSEYTSRLRHRALKLFYASLPKFGILSIADTNYFDLMPFISNFTAVSSSLGLYRK